MSAQTIIETVRRKLAMARTYAGDAQRAEHRAQAGPAAAAAITHINSALSSIDELAMLAAEEHAST